MNTDDLRRIALTLPEAAENAHFGKPDFRVRNRIFASLPASDRAVVKLTPEQQEVMCAAEPAMFEPIGGAWGRKGWTSVDLTATDQATLQSALTTAWKNVAPGTLRNRLG
jgi:hypothetical protein